MIEHEQKPNATFFEQSQVRQEQERLESDFEILEATEGFRKLTSRQQELIKASLRLQVQSERRDPPGVTGYDSIFVDAKVHVKNWYCHQAVLNLEVEGNLTTDTDLALDALPLNFAQANYITPDSYEALEDHVVKHGFPSVVHLNAHSTMDKASAVPNHTLVALGRNEDGQIVIWEKEDEQRPYNVSTLNKVYERFRNQASHPWGVRNLRNREEYNI